MGLRRGFSWVVLMVAGVLGLGLVAPAQGAVALPGGKANWVVAVGGLNLARANDFRDWVRLGYYVFATDGTVEHNYWSWNRRDEPVRVDTVLADCFGDVPDCSVKSVSGFTGSPTGGFRGTFTTLADGRLQVRWTHNTSGAALATPLTEFWNLDENLGKVARISSATMFDKSAEIPAPGVFSDYSATFGIGYGSNATLDGETRATMSQLRNDERYNARPYTGSFQVATGGGVQYEGTGGPWLFSTGTPVSGDPNFRNAWKMCANAQCIGWNQHGTGCDCGNGDADRDRIRYIAEIGGGRRNTEWYWCQCLAQGRPCYQANSHPRPMLQIVDDDGVFQGWVGIEAFTHVNATTLRPDQDWDAGYFGVFDMVPPPLSR
jgi:hypothetical protein